MVLGTFPRQTRRRDEEFQDRHLGLGRQQTRRHDLRDGRRHHERLRALPARAPRIPRPKHRQGSRGTRQGNLQGLPACGRRFLFHPTPIFRRPFPSVAKLFEVSSNSYSSCIQAFCDCIYTNTFVFNNETLNS